MACSMGRRIVDFDRMGVFAILFSSSDPELLKDYADSLLAPLDAYDRRYAQTLRAYIENDRSLAKTAEAVFIHRNTVSYRIRNMRQLLHCSLSSPEELFPYQIAFLIRDMGL